MRPGVFFVTLASVTCGLVAPPTASPALHVPLAPVQAENAKAGTPAWTAIPSASWPEIQLYTSETSVLPGTTVHVHVSTTPPALYRLEIFRLGWYGGVGARLVGCEPSCIGTEQGSTLPIPAPDTYGEVRANWPVTDTFTLPAAATSGYYEIDAILMNGPDKGSAEAAPLIVREPSDQRSAILVVAAVNTWEAYNNWGGKSLYAYNSGGDPAVKVSFDRPYGPDAQSPLLWEYPLVRFLERGGYDVSYTTDVDVDQDPADLLRHQLVIVAGHDEYWTTAMRDAFETALAGGTNLAFFGADIGTWQARFEDAGRTLVEYRSITTDPEIDPALKTVRFRDLGRPECALLGVEFQGGGASAGDSPRDFTITSAGTQSPWAPPGFTGSLPGLVGYEWDAVVPGCTPSGAVTLLHYQGRPTDADAVVYTAASGAQVFSAGSLQFNWGLDGYGGHGSYASPGLQAFAGRMLDDLGRPPAPTTTQAANAGSSVRIEATAAPASTFVIVRHLGAALFTAGASGVTVICQTSGTTCLDREARGHRTYTYAAATLRGSALSPLTFSSPVEVPNHPPSLRLHLSRDATTVRIRALALDTDGDRLRLSWKIGSKRVHDFTDVIRLETGTRRLHVSCSVYDGHGGVATARLVIHNVG